MSGNAPEPLMTAKEAAAYLRFAEGTIRNMASAGTIPRVKIGTALRFRRSELDEWVAERDAESRVAL